MTIPSHLSYTVQHEWMADSDGVSTVGITSYASDALGDVVFIDLPPVGSALVAGETCGEIESTKSVSDVVSPGTGEVVEVNAAALDDPDVVNTDPYGQGWLFRARWSETPSGMDAAAYRRFIRLD